MRYATVERYNHHSQCWEAMPGVPNHPSMLCGVFTVVKEEVLRLLAQSQKWEEMWVGVWWRGRGPAWGVGLVIYLSPDPCILGDPGFQDYRIFFYPFFNLSMYQEEHSRSIYLA